METEFCDILGMLRRERGISQRRAAADLGISQALLSHYEKGIREPGLPFVARACKYYNVTSDYLLGITPTRYNGTDLDEKTCQDEPCTVSSAQALADSLETAFKILNKYGDAELIEQAARHLSTAIYKLTRYIFMLNPQMQLQNTLVPEDSFGALCNMDILLTELRFKKQISKCVEYPSETGYQQKYPDTDFTLLCRHLIQLLEDTDNRIANHFKENL